MATVVCPHALPHAQLSSDWSRGWPPLYRTHSTSIISEPPSSPGGATPVSQVRRIEAHRAMPSAVELGVQVAPSYPTPKLFPSDAHPPSGRPASQGQDGGLEAAPPAGRLPCHFLVSGRWASQRQPRTPGKGATRETWPQVKAAFCTNFSGFRGLGFCFFLLSGNA